MVLCPPLFVCGLFSDDISNYIGSVTSLLLQVIEYQLQSGMLMKSYASNFIVCKKKFEHLLWNSYKVHVSCAVTCMVKEFVGLLQE